MRIVRTSARLLTTGAALMLAGCGGSPRELPHERTVYPAFGMAYFKGEPIPDASVVLHPIDSADREISIRPRGVVKDDGTFELTTYRRGDGAPPGEYKVTVSWVGSLDGVDEDDEHRLPERLPRRYTRPDTSDITVTITEGQNILPEIVLN